MTREFLLSVSVSKQLRNPMACRRRQNFGERVFSIFLAKLWLPSFILIASEGWGEKEIFTKGVGDRQE